MVFRSEITQERYSGDRGAVMYYKYAILHNFKTLQVFHLMDVIGLSRYDVASPNTSTSQSHNQLDCMDCPR